ncbi:MAG TPA: choice-of-anchor tandem repeat GloVer-containing protein [Bacteroidia bacterium]|nr:choice-of-anchor tandem repeat GloVer-containing protein [Bacteroidia bacterium]
MKKLRSTIYTCLGCISLLLLIPQKNIAQTVFYGMTDNGGAYSGGAYGTIFKFDPATSIETIEWSFGNGTDGLFGYGDIVYDANNQLFYIMALEGGTHGSGVIATFNPTTNAEAVVWNFGSGTDGAIPLGALTYDASKGLFYGFTQLGGTNSQGTIISFNPITNAEAVVWNFGTGTDGAQPRGSLIYNPVNHLYYGMTSVGGTNSQGTIITFDPTTNTEAVVWNFGTGSDGTQPWGELAYDATNGLYFAMTSGGGSHGAGSIISFNTSTNAEALVWSFGGPGDGSSPYGDLIYDTATHLFYGMTYAGGANNKGTILSFNPGTNTETVINSFNGTDGATPYGSFTYDKVKNMYYAMPTYGGTSNAGTIISFNAATNKDSVLYNFLGTPDGFYPRDRVLIYSYSNEGIDEVNANSNSVSLYPNPSKGILNLSIRNYQAGIKNYVEVYNILGEKVYSNQLTMENGQLAINLSNETSGVYLYRLTTETGSLLGEGKFVIQK